MGIALAALPHGENDPCIDFRSEELVDYPPVEYSLFPYLLGYGDVANLVGIATGAGLAWGIDWLRRRVRRGPASPAAP